MEKEEYFNEIEHFIKKYEVNKRTRAISANYEELEIKWNIGKLLVEAQGGESRAKYGNELIKKWSKEFTKNYGKGYNIANLKRFRQYYLLFSKGATMSNQLSWSQIVEILPIKEENKRNYYINMCINYHLSIRDLRQRIKSNSYERLINKPEHIEIIEAKHNLTIKDNMKNPIILEVSKNEEVKSEKDLELLILSRLKSFFEQLGSGFTLVGSEYKVVCDNKSYYIDILLFNYKFNAFVVVELKYRELRIEDKMQVYKYMHLVDQHVKEHFHHPTLGIIITKEQDDFVMNFVKDDNIIPLTYELLKNI